MFDAMPRDAVTEAPKNTLRWTIHLSVLAILTAVSCYFYRDAIAAATTVWVVSPTFTHCFLIIPISAWLVWRRRDIVAAITPSVEPLALVLIPPILALWLVGALTMINEIQQFAFVALLQALMLVSLGRKIYREILFPALFLFFLVPTGAYLITPLQDFTSSFVAAGLRILGVTFVREGTMLSLPSGRFEVAEACAGLRFLIATISLGVLFCGLTFTRWPKIFLFMVASCIIPVIANGFRALIIVMLAYLSNNRIAVGFDHLVYGWGFSVAILMLLFFIGSKYRDPIPDETPRAFFTTEKPLATIATGLAAMILLALGPASLAWAKAEEGFSSSATLDALAEPAPGWVRQDISTPWRPSFQQPDQQIGVGLTKADQLDSPPVFLLVDYYAGFRDGHQLLASANQLWDGETWHELQSGTKTIDWGGTQVAVKTELVSSFAENRLLWSVYWIDGKFVAGGVRAKLQQLYALLTGRPAGALITISTNARDSLPDAENRLMAVAETLGTLPARLQHVSNAKAGSS